MIEPPAEAASEAAPPPPQPATRPQAIDRLRSNPATGGLIVVTLLVFLGQSLSSALLGFDLLLSLGVKANDAVLAGELWRFFTPIFLHVGVAHVLVNMYSLYVIGPAVERPFGSVRFLLVYFLAGVSGVAFSLAFSPFPSAGASGAIFGLLGAFAGFLYQHRSLLGRAGVGQLRHIVLVAIVNLLIGLSPGIDNWGHVGGLVFGLGLSFLLGPRYQIEWRSDESGSLADRRPSSAIITRALIAVALCLGLAASAALAASLR